MALNINGVNPTKIVYNGTSLTKVIYNGITVWISEYQIFQNGVLPSGVTTSGFTNSGGVLSASAYAEPRDEDEDDTKDTVYASITGIDLTNYSTIDITLNYENTAVYGTETITYGFDGNYNYTLPKNNRYGTTIISLDVSSLTGIHTVNFKLYAKNSSTYYSADGHINITNIKLHNSGITHYQPADVYVNGAVANNILVIENLSNSNNALRGDVSTDEDESDSITCTVGGMDFTNYSTMTVDVSFTSYDSYSGHADCYYGIDGAGTFLAKDNNYNGTLTFNISSYTGLHSLVFRLSAEDDSSADIAISKIKLS